MFENSADDTVKDLQALESAFKQGKVRLQSASATLLAKFNDFDQSMLRQLRNDMHDTYKKLKISFEKKR